jgi:hypothetical protein
VLGEGGGAVDDADCVAGLQPQFGEQAAQGVGGLAGAGGLGGGLAPGGGRARCLGDRVGLVGALFVVEGQFAPRVAQVPFEVEGERAQEYVRADALLEAVVDRADLELGTLEDAKVALDFLELFLGAHDVGRVQAL